MLCLDVGERLLQIAFVFSIETFYSRFFIDGFLMLQILLVEDVTTETGDFFINLPVLFVRIEFVLDICQNGVVHIVANLHSFNHLVDSISKCFLLVEIDAQVGGQIQLACQVADNTLEERIDGFDAEMAVVVENERKSYLTGLSNRFLRLSVLESFGQHLQVAVCTMITGGDPVKRLNNTSFHLVGSLVGKCHS